MSGVFGMKAITGTTQADRKGKQYLSDVLTHILNDHLISSDGLHGEQAPLMDPAASKSQLLLSELHRDDKSVTMVSVKMYPGERHVYMVNVWIMLLEK